MEITRGATTLTPVQVRRWALTRPGRTVVHQVLGDPSPDVTEREPGLWAGDLATLWETYAAASAAVVALSTPGGPWTWPVPEDAVATMLATVVGDVRIENGTDKGAPWVVTATVQEVAP